MGASGYSLGATLNIPAIVTFGRPLDLRGSLNTWPSLEESRGCENAMRIAFLLYTFVVCGFSTIYSNFFFLVVTLQKDYSADLTVDGFVLRADSCAE